MDSEVLGHRVGSVEMYSCEGKVDLYILILRKAGTSRSRAKNWHDGSLGALPTRMSMFSVHGVTNPPTTGVNIENPLACCRSRVVNRAVAQCVQPEHESDHLNHEEDSCWYSVAGGIAQYQHKALIQGRISQISVVCPGLMNLLLAQRGRNHGSGHIVLPNRQAVII